MLSRTRFNHLQANTIFTLDRIRLKASALIGNRIARGLGWSAVSLAATRGISLVARLLLARLLMPEDFGLIAMIMVFLGLVNILLDFGLKQALIQRGQEGVSPARYDTAFWFLTGSGFFWAVIVATFGAQLIAFVFGEQEVVELARVMALGVFFHATSILPEVRLVRLMRFKQLSKAEVYAAIASFAVAVALAFSGAGAWALAAQQVLNLGIKTLLYWRETKWRPRLRFEIKLLRDLRRFSGFMFGSQILHYVRLNSDNLAIGTFVGASSLGAYSLSYLITETIRSQVGAVVARVMFPAYSQAAGQIENMRLMHLAVVKYMCLAIFPLAAALAVKSSEIITLAFGDQWSEAALPTSILSGAAAVMAVSGDPSSLLKGLGRGGTIFTLHAINTLLIGVPAIMIGAYYYGVVGAACGVLLQSMVHSVMMFSAMHRFVGTTALGVLKAVLPGTALACFVVILCATI